MASTTGDQRDLRSAQQDSKRFKDSSTKWSHGARPSYGCKVDWQTLEAAGGNDGQKAKMRPRGKNSDVSTHHKKRDPNVVKGRASWLTPPKRVQAMVKAKHEIQDLSMSRSLVGPGGPYTQRRPSLSDSFTYSFDRTESSNRPQSLDLYVKSNTERDTERLVQREYEVLDTHGEALRGKKAKMDLRQAGIAERMSVDDDGFELI